MINVQDALQAVPHFEAFCSVTKLHTLVEVLGKDSRFQVRVAGTSVGGVPIHHIRFGAGSVKALFVAFPHCMEPVGGLTVYSLMTLLQQRNRALIEADVEWHIVPCIDPDGALLNEGWTQKPYTPENYMRNVYMQAPQDQVDMSFPITYKKLVRSNQPSREAKILQGLLDEIRPDFFFSLHNARTGGAFFFLSRDIDHKYYREIYKLLDQEGIPVEKRVQHRQFLAQFGEGISDIYTSKKLYDYLEQTIPSPEDLLPFGTSSQEYLAEIKPSALIFVAEINQAVHPSDNSEKDTGQNLRQFRLRLDADSKFLASVLLDEWEKVKDDLDSTSPFYRALVGYALPTKERIVEGGFPLSRFPTRDVLFNSQHDRTMAEGDLYAACMVESGFFFPLWSYQFVRLLKESRQTSAVRHAIERLERVFDEALAEIGRYVDFDAFEIIDCDRLAKVQLGSGLIVLNSILEKQYGGLT